MTDDVKSQVERDGMPDAEGFECPVCGCGDCETLYVSGVMHGIVGCDQCVDMLDPREAGPVW